MNALKTAMLLGLLSVLLMVGGQAVAGRQGMIIGLVLAVGMNFFSYFFSEKMALSMYRAQQITPEDNPAVYARVFPIVQNLTSKMNLPMPRLWVIPEAQPNAFATGRNPEHSSVAMTEGLLAQMNDRELEGVLAHELGHVKHRDILISSVAATLAAALTQIAYMAMWFGGGRSDDEENRSPYAGILMIILAPIAAGLIQMAISRTREFSADGAAARYTGSPDGLISALGKLERGVQKYPMEANQATAHMFITNPFSGGGLTRLFSTHPSTEQRIANLEALRMQGVH
ncbi:MAG: zinc metalloprotease HtpX [Acidobacteriota bacterium]